MSAWGRRSSACPPRHHATAAAPPSSSFILVSLRVLQRDLYAPELNPVEPLWGANLRGVELANLAAKTLEEVIAAAERGIQRIRHSHHLAFSFLRHCGLS
jgi:hypothetical protein